MEYTELDAAAKRELLKNNLRSWEAQHLARAMDARRFTNYLEALEAGEFAKVDSRVRNDRKVNWTLQRDQAVMDVHAFELDMAMAKAELAALPEDAPAAEEA